MQMTWQPFRSWRPWALVLVALTLAACAGSGRDGGGGRYASRHDGAPAAPPDVLAIPDAVPRHEPRSRHGNPASYVVFGKRYHVMPTSAGYVERGIASWYGTKFHGHRTSSGETYDMYAMTAAHKSLPLPTYARVTNLRNGRSVVVKINDRGPFHDNRIIDLSYAAAARLGILGQGTGLVEVRAIQPGETEPGPRVIEARAPAPPVRQPAAAAGPSLYLQVGAFLNRANAEQLTSRLRQVPLPHIHISQGVSDRRPVYRVRIGPLASVAEADRVAAQLGSHGIANPHVVID